MEEGRASLLSKWRAVWSVLSLAKQFALASLLVISLGMFGLGHWINAQIREGVIQHTASTTTFYMASFVEPLAQNLESQKTFNAETNKAFDALLNGPLKGKLVAIKIWNLDGSIAYSNFYELIGQRFPIDNSLAGALRGEIKAELGYTSAAENLVERKLDLLLLEVYSPIHHLTSGKLIGVGEFYLNSDDLLDDLKKQTIRTWGLVGILTVSMIGILSAIMFSASTTIDQQQIQLNQQVFDLSQLLEANDQLNKNLGDANKNAVLLNDRLLNRLGSDLHDGPAQLLSFALLRLPSIAENGNKQNVSESKKLQKAIKEALTEIRLISTGLNMPQLENCSLKEVAKLAIENHESMTRTKVDLKVENIPRNALAALKVCVYRVIQEGLANSFKHGGGIGQSVTLRESDNKIVLEVSDKGKGFIWKPDKDNSKHLGLFGLLNRVHVLGGTVNVVSAPNKGCCITAIFPIDPEAGKK